MTNEKVYLYDDKDDVYLDVFLCDESDRYSITTRPLILICPGGAYFGCSPREAEPIARAYMAEGYNAAVLYYTVKSKYDVLYDFENDVSKPHYEVAKSICIIRDNAEKWHVYPEKIAVIGFSAGGHLAGCASILWNDEKLMKMLKCPEGYNRPNAAILGYPVITSGEKAHNGSFNHLLGENATAENRLRYSLEKQVKEGVPPTFIFHTANDNAVAVENSTYLMSALAAHKIPFECHILPDGAHGMSLSNREVLPVPSKYNARWLGWSIKWLETIFFNTEA